MSQKKGVIIENITKETLTAFVKNNDVCGYATRTR